MFSRRSFLHTQSASSPNDVDVNSTSSSNATRDREEVSYFNSTSTASSNIFRRGRNSMFVSGEDALSSFDCREDRNESDDRKAGSNVSSAKNCVAGRPRRTPPPDGYLSMMSTRQKNHAAETID
eukprot:8396687-Prorocentrum_lima.AAC.1